MSLPIGIDLGTTNSLGAVFADGAPRLIPNSSGDVLTPSVVGLIDSGDVIVGTAARELAVTRPDAVSACFKRWMGTDRDLTVAGRKFTPIELSSLVLRSIKADAEAHLENTVDEAVITVPAYFNDHQRRATKTAGELAGLKVRRIINEPTAAALTYGFHEREAEKRFLVFDLGGGTFDVTVMEVFEGTLEILSSAGESQLGGEDFTSRLVAFILQRIGLNLETVEFREPLRFARLRNECERAKRALCDAEEAPVRLPDASGQTDPDRSESITRADFRTVTQPLMQRLAKPVFRALRDAELSEADIEDVLLVGGATRMPLIVEFVREAFGREPRVGHDPDRVVALGAAIQSALAADDEAVGDMVMTDVAPFTLGVAVTKELAGRRRDGYYLPVIHRNTTIPVSKEEIVQTVQDNQDVVAVRVFQGEARRTEENLLLGSFDVTGLPPAPAGLEVRIRFTYDLNGILEVEVFVPASGRKYNTVIVPDGLHMNKKEKAAALKKMQALKFYPRDDLQNRELLHFAERVVGEVNQYERDGLETVVDHYEHCLHGGNQEDFEQARNALLHFLSRLGYHFKKSQEE